jgi:hypothetical protein
MPKPPSPVRPLQSPRSQRRLSQVRMIGRCSMMQGPRQGRMRPRRQREPCARLESLRCTAFSARPGHMCPQQDRAEMLARSASGVATRGTRGPCRATGPRGLQLQTACDRHMDSARANLLKRAMRGGMRPRVERLRCRRRLLEISNDLCRSYDPRAGFPPCPSPS